MPAKISAKKDDLFALIKSLSATERSYFKKMAKRHSNTKQSLHLKLFTFIEKSKNNINTQYAQQLGIQSQAQYSLLKKYLFTEILDVLTFAARNQNKEKGIEAVLFQIQLLTDRRIYGSAAKMIAKEKAQAIKNQLLYKLDRLLITEYHLLKFGRGKELSLRLEQQSQAIAAHAALMTAFYTINTCLRNIIFLKNKSNNRVTPEEIIEVKREMAPLQYVNEENLSHPLLAIIFHCSNAMGYYLSLERVACDLHCKKLLNLWQASPHLVNFYPDLFKESAHTVFYNSFSQHTPGQVEKELIILHELAQQLTSINAYKRWEVIAFNTRIKICHKTADYETVSKLLKEEGAYITAIAMEELSVPELLSILTTIAISYYVVNNYKAADALLYQIKELNHYGMRKDIYYFSLLFHLVIMFEFGDWYRLSNAITAAYQQLYSQKQIRPFEKTLMLFLKKISGSGTKEKTHRMIKEFLRDLYHYKNDPVKNMYFLYFNYYGWLQSILEEIPYSDFVTKHVKSTVL